MPTRENKPLPERLARKVMLLGDIGVGKTSLARRLVLDRFDAPVRVVRDDGFPVDGEVYVEVEGSVPVTMAKSVGFATIEFASELQRLEPDLVLLVGDRYEAFAAAIAAAYSPSCIKCRTFSATRGVPALAGLDAAKTAVAAKIPKTIGK